MSGGVNSPGKDRVRTRKVQDGTSARTHGDTAPRDLTVPQGGVTFTREQYYAALGREVPR